MKRSIVLLGLILSFTLIAQEDQSKQWRAFPLTGYFVDLDDSTRVVQVMLPEGQSFSENQLGLVRGVYRNNFSDTVIKGFGKCRLVKENYYYFAIAGNRSGIEIKEGDLLYTFVPREKVYDGELTGLATHFITLQDVYDQPFYDPHTVFSKWEKDQESSILDTMVKDIQFTGDYFTRNEPSMDKLIASGRYKGRKVLEVMTSCRIDDLIFFMDYVKARPLLYAGRNWKLSEVFATWLVEGAPTVVRK